MKIYIIGTSNSVMRNGWVAGLKNNKKIEVINLSVGRTPCLMHIATIMMYMQELKQADLIILDHIINDINYYIPRIGERYYDYIDDLLAIVASINKPIVNIMFPISNMKDIKHGFLTSSKIKNLCDKYLIYYIDLNSFDLDVRYYKDKVHLKEEIAVFIGKELSRLLYKYKFNSSSKRSLSNNPYQIFSYEDISLSRKNDTLPTEISEFSNSLGTFKYIQLNHVVELSQFNGYELLAIAYFNEENKTHTFQVNTNMKTMSYRTTNRKFFLEMLDEPILIDKNSSIQKSKNDVTDIPCLMGRDDEVYQDIVGANISYFVFRDRHTEFSFVESNSMEFDANLTPLLVESMGKIDFLFRKQIIKEVKITPIEIATETKKANIEKLGKMNEKKIAMILKMAFSHINKEIANAKDGRVIIPGLGNFNIRTIENEMDGKKVARKRILFSAEKNKTGASP